MSRKHYRPDVIIAKLREAGFLMSQGGKIADVVTTIGVHEATYNRWRKEYGGMKVTPGEAPARTEGRALESV